LAGAGALFGCNQSGQLSGEPAVPVVRVSLPLERKVTDYEYFTGRTGAVDDVEIRARVTGYLEKIYFEPGKEVKAGQPLFLIDPRPYKAQLDLAESQVLLNEAQLSLAQANLARGRNLSKTPGAISQEDLDNLVSQAKVAGAAVKSAKANVESAQLNMLFTNITAPVSGAVGRNLLTIGNLVSQDSTLLTTLVSYDPMYAYFDVDERTMLNIQKLIREGKMQSAKTGHKTPVQFGLANEGEDYPHEGYIDFVNNQVDTGTGTLQVRGLIDNPKIGKGDTRLLTPGLFVRVRVPIGPAHQALLIPQAALGTDQGQKFVYVIGDKNKVEYRPVSPAAMQSDGLQVVEPIMIVQTKEGERPALEGEKGVPSLTPTDQVIVGGLQRVRSGMVVNPKKAAEMTK
jgi:multidrug efflux system membrane fusion protein